MSVKIFIDKVLDATDLKRHKIATIIFLNTNQTHTKQTEIYAPELVTLVVAILSTVIVSTPTATDTTDTVYDDSIMSFIRPFLYQTLNDFKWVPNGRKLEPIKYSSGNKTFEELFLDKIKKNLLKTL